MRTYPPMGHHRDVDLDQMDRMLARLRDTVAVMSSNLVDLESDSVRMRLDQATLAGTTATRWAEAKVALGLLWQWFSQLNEVLDRAGQLRGTKQRVEAERLSELSSLLAAQSIELSSADIPLANVACSAPARRRPVALPMSC